MVLAKPRMRIEHLYKTYPNEVTATKNFSLDINDEEFVVFVGLSGCGKSTVLRMIAGLEDITSGSITLDDEDSRIKRRKTAISPWSSKTMRFTRT